MRTNCDADLDTSRTTKKRVISVRYGLMLSCFDTATETRGWARLS